MATSPLPQVAVVYAVVLRRQSIQFGLRAAQFTSSSLHVVTHVAIASSLYLRHYRRLEACVGSWGSMGHFRRERCSGTPSQRCWGRPPKTCPLLSWWSAATMSVRICITCMQLHHRHLNNTHTSEHASTQARKHTHTPDGHNAGRSAAGTVAEILRFVLEEVASLRVATNL